MLLDNIGCILDSVARLLIRSGLLEDVCGENISQIMRSMRQQTFDSSASGIWIIDTITLDHCSPGLVEGGGIIGGIEAACLHRLDKESARISRSPEQDPAVPVDIGKRYL